MKCEQFRRLMSREVDGMATPGEEALLMTHVQVCDECAVEHEAQHRVHRAFAETPRPTPPADLASRIADRVLAGAGSSASPRLGVGRREGFRFGWPPARAAAAILLSVLLAGTGGWFYGRGIEVTVASPNAAIELMEREVRAWVALGADPVTARKIAEIKARYQPRLANADGIEWSKATQEMEAEVLRQMPPALLEQYRLQVGLPADEVQRILSQKGATR